MKGVRWVGILSAMAPMHTVFAQVNHWNIQFQSVVINVHFGWMRNISIHQNT